MIQSIKRGVVLLFLIHTGAFPLCAQARALTLKPESALWLVGDSTLHPFTSRTQQLDLFAEMAAGRNTLLESGALKNLKLVIPVESLKSKEVTLDKNMYKALKTGEHPAIIFEMTGYEINPSTISVSASHVKVAGTLQVAGTQQAIELHSEAIPEPASLRVQGQYSLLMTDYGIKPPTMMLGTIKVKNKVTIHFDLHIDEVD
jgi:hypothetical protein